MLCPHTERPLKFYCRDDQKCICEECCSFTHREHNMVAMQEERKEREQMVEKLLQTTRGEIHKRELNLQKIMSTSEYIKVSSKRAVEAYDRMFDELKASLERMKEGLNRAIQEREEALLCQAQLEEREQSQALLTLQATIIDLETLPQIKEDIIFITKSQSLVSQQETDPVTVHVDKYLSFEFPTIDTKKAKEMLEDCCEDAIEKIQGTVQNAQLLELYKEMQSRSLSPNEPVQRSSSNASGFRPPWRSPSFSGIRPLQRCSSNASWFRPPPRLPTKPKTRQALRQHACPLTVDLDTAHPTISVDHKRQQTLISVDVKRSKKKICPKGFDRWVQVLCKEPLRGGCFYWEVEWSGKVAFIGITREDIARRGDGVECGLGRNVNSWCLECSNNSHSVWHNDSTAVVTDNISSPRIGIFLEHNVGSLTFYSISDKMTPIHTYTSEKLSGPLYLAFGFGLDCRQHSCIKLQNFENP